MKQYRAVCPECEMGEDVLVRRPAIASWHWRRGRYDVFSVDKRCRGEVHIEVRDVSPWRAAP